VYRVSLAEDFCYSCTKRTHPLVKSAHVSAVESDWCWLSALATPYSRPVCAGAVLKTRAFLFSGGVKYTLSMPLTRREHFLVLIELFDDVVRQLMISRHMRERGWIYSRNTHISMQLSLRCTHRIIPFRNIAALPLLASGILL
jgi:hypothetical protein